jgi:hypothetical protein
VYCIFYGDLSVVTLDGSSLNTSVEALFASFCVGVCS